MANERVFTYRNTGTEEAPVWEKWFQKTVADAVYLADESGDASEQTIVQYVNQKIADLIGGAPATYDTLKEIADYIASHQSVETALNAAIADKADKNHTHKEATSSAAGFLSAADKKKLDGMAAGATANDTKYKNQTPSTVAVGGIEKGYVPPADGVEAIDMIDKLLHPYVAPQVSAAAKPSNGGTFEIGTTQSVTGIDVTVTLGSSAIEKIEAFDGETVLGTLTSGIKAGVNTVTFTEALSVTAAKQLSVTATDQTGKAVTAKTGSFSFVSPYYYRSIAAEETPTEALVKAAKKAVQGKGNKTFSFTCANQRMLFAYPKAYGALRQILDANNFDVTGTFVRSEVTVNGVDYYAYCNDPSTVTEFKMTFNY